MCRCLFWVVQVKPCSGSVVVDCGFPTLMLRVEFKSEAQGAHRRVCSGEMSEDIAVEPSCSAFGWAARWVLVFSPVHAGRLIPPGGSPDELEC